MNIIKSGLELIGTTPLLEPGRYMEMEGITAAKLYAKLECYNMAGSAKDRVALEIIEAAEQAGTLKPGATIIEPTSGNTGIGLAAVAAIKGYKTVIVLPDTMSVERRNLMKAYGSKIVLTDGALGMKGAIEKAEELHKSLSDSIIAGQFVNPANPDAHRKTTALEIFEALDGQIDVFVAGVGTGGTITGVGEYLKSKNPAVRIIGVEPEDCPVFTKGHGGAHKIQGIGAGFVPEVLKADIMDEVRTVSTEEAFETARNLAKTEGILTGISSGAALFIATQIAKSSKYAGKNIVVLLPDSGDRYLSTELYQFE